MVQSETQLPALHTSSIWHFAGEPHWPSEPHVCMSTASVHEVALGVHVTQTPSKHTGVLPEHEAPNFNQPALVQSCGCGPLHWNVPAAQPPMPLPDTPLHTYVVLTGPANAPMPLSVPVSISVPPLGQAAFCASVPAPAANGVCTTRAFNPFAPAFPGMPCGPCAPGAPASPGMPCGP